MYATVKCLDLIYEHLSNLKLREKIFDEGMFEISSFSKTKIKPFFDSQVYENLEVFRIKNEEEGEGKKGTLFAYLNSCLTNSGQKLLKRWLNEPLVTKQAIYDRQRCIQEIV
jgi:DNA mismatch repair protein MSH6